MPNACGIHFSCFYGVASEVNYAQCPGTLEMLPYVMHGLVLEAVCVLYMCHCVYCVRVCRDEGGDELLDFKWENICYFAVSEHFFPLHKIIMFAKDAQQGAVTFHLLVLTKRMISVRALHERIVNGHAAEVMIVGMKDFRSVPVPGGPFFSVKFFILAKRVSFAIARKSHFGMCTD